MKFKISALILSLVFTSAAFAKIDDVTASAATTNEQSTFNYNSHESFTQAPNFKQSGEKKVSFNYNGDESFPLFPNFEYKSDEYASDFNYNSDESFPLFPKFYYGDKETTK